MAPESPFVANLGKRSIRKPRGPQMVRQAPQVIRSLCEDGGGACPRSRSCRPWIHGQLGAGIHQKITALGPQRRIQSSRNEVVRLGRVATDGHHDCWQKLPSGHDHRLRRFSGRSTVVRVVLRALAAGPEPSRALQVAETLSGKPCRCRAAYRAWNHRTGNTKTDGTVVVEGLRPANTSVSGVFQAVRPSLRQQL